MDLLRQRSQNMVIPPPHQITNMFEHAYFINLTESDNRITFNSINSKFIHELYTSYKKKLNFYQKKQK